MTSKKLFLSMFAMAILWSCSKDDGPKEFANQPPVIYDQTLNVLEKTVTDTQTVGLVKAYDANMVTKLAFSITANSNDLFVIEGATGALGIKTGKTLDLVETPLQKITVAVTDGEREDSAEITICDCTPTFAKDAYEFEVSENISSDELIHAFEIIDVDTDPKDLVITISTNDNGLFAINTKGELRLASNKSLDFETATEHNIKVSVTDGVETTEVEVKIVVLNEVEGISDDPTSFVTTWKTEEAGEKIVIGTQNAYNYDFTIDWGDGTVEDIVQVNVGSFEHTYEEAGTYTVAIQGVFPAIRMENSNTKGNLIGLEQWGDIAWYSMTAAFLECENMIYNATDVPDISNVSSMLVMFAGATAFNGDLSLWNVENVTDMGAMFSGATTFNGDLSDWDTKNITNMSYMFSKAEAFDQDLGGWKIGSIEDMSNMFDNSGMSKENLNATIIGWNSYVDANNGPIDISVGIDNLTVCGAAALSAGDNLMLNYNWEFTGTAEFLEECN
ncbi:BspA family leucine-rich repeat surface protein [Muricauda oceani]|uniref:BspA family leucine-rich repeat surface protein n=1 Tax=Flagellimonas oceani TaxID=2698672 RepID=A0A6G7J276_9FLAO|nr:BspA family leucine-rich repeat surface protein [Allomuricauda oceani]MBW8241226.1 BspA family leucine-rich repeat surface protein [Allomuricauda oceani]QII44770.1 BspA family leucine-rich repeat surface protein [Allomuricauda oceani]